VHYYGISVLVITLLPALATVSHAQRGLLPPEEFDHPYDGRIVIQMARDQAEVRELCKGMVFHGPALGCARGRRDFKICYIAKVSDDEIRAAGYDPEHFMRHEIGHCNGWPPSHVGARSIEEAAK